MGPPAIGDVVLIPFPYSDLSQAKRRPALVIADVGMGDFVLCQITSRSYADRLGTLWKTQAIYAKISL